MQWMKGGGSRWPYGPDTIDLHSFLHMIPVHNFKLYTFSLHEVKLGMYIILSDY